MLMNHLCALIAQPSCIQTEGNYNLNCSPQFLLLHKLKPFNCLLPCTIATAATSIEIVVVFEYEGLATPTTS